MCFITLILPTTGTRRKVGCAIYAASRRQMQDALREIVYWEGLGVDGKAI
jgi:hypothetical protein